MRTELDWPLYCVFKAGVNGAISAFLRRMGVFIAPAMIACLGVSGCGDSSSSPASPPSVPVVSTPIHGDATVTLTWSAVSGATGYNVYYGSSSADAVVVSATNANTTKLTVTSVGTQINNLTNGTTYYFAVTAVGTGGEGAASNVVSATPNVPVAGAPTGVSAMATSTQVMVSWTAVPYAATYNIYYATTSSGAVIASTNKVTGIPATATTITVFLATSSTTITSKNVNGNAIGSVYSGSLSFANGTPYYFVVTAVNSAGESAVSGVVSATPSVQLTGVPYGVSVIGYDSSATASWDPVPLASSYNVYYAPTPGNAVVVASTNANTTKVTGVTNGRTITGLTNGTAYYFVVTAVVSGVESAASTIVSAVPQLLVPSAPSGLNSSNTSTNGDTINLSWALVGGAATYNVYYSTDATYAVVVPATNTATTKITGATSAASMAVTGLTPGTQYVFVVTAVNTAGGESAASSQWAAIPQVTGTGGGGTITLHSIPDVPTGVSAVSPSSGSMTVTWNAALYATSYNVYYSSTQADATTSSPTNVIGINTLTTTIPGLTPGINYWFVVTGKNQFGESAASSQANAIP